MILMTYISNANNIPLYIVVAVVIVGGSSNSIRWYTT